MVFGFVLIYIFLSNSTKAETIFPRLERQLGQIMKLLARILFMCILQCKTGTCWTTDPTMKLLASAQFMSILQCKTGTCTKIKLIKESPFRLRRYSRIKYHSKIMPMVTMCTFKNISESFMDCFY